MPRRRCCAVAANGQEAVDLVRSRDFDVVLMDLQMPVMDGYLATGLIRAEPRHARLPIIAMTAHALSSDRQRCLDAGMNDHVAKPFEAATLFGVLARWIAPEAPAAAPAERAVESPPPSGISFELGLRRCLGRTELYRKILHRFLETRANDPAAIRAALVLGDRDGAAQIAHSSVSTSGTIGAERLSDAARQLQLALDTDEAGSLALLDTFAAEHALVLTALRAHLAADAAG
jgi:two-component system sensor histidine kinase/response regulator